MTQGCDTLFEDFNADYDLPQVGHLYLAQAARTAIITWHKYSTIVKQLDTFALQFYWSLISL
jgi:hypothetical protein